MVPIVTASRIFTCSLPSGPFLHASCLVGSVLAWKVQCDAVWRRQHRHLQVLVRRARWIPNQHAGRFRDSPLIIHDLCTIKVRTALSSLKTDVSYGVVVCVVVLEFPADLPHSRRLHPHTVTS